MKTKVLIVDDEQAIRDLIADFLEDTCEVTKAASATALRKTFTGEQPDVIILDVNLKEKDVDGFKLLPEIKKHWQETQVIILTGQVTDDEAVSWAVKATKLGAFNFLRKPITDWQKVYADIACAHEYKQQK
jgi:two-component system nitrogen regulation response regulator NtrX